MSTVHVDRMKTWRGDRIGRSRVQWDRSAQQTTAEEGDEVIGEEEGEEETKGGVTGRVRW